MTEHWSGWTEHLVWDPVTVHNNWVLLIFSCSSFIYLRIPINSVSHVNKLNLAGVGRMNPTHHMMWREVSVCLMCGCRFFLLFDKSKINAKHGVSLIACKVLCCYKDCNLFLCCLFSLVECGQGRQELRGWSEFYEMNCNAYLRFLTGNVMSYTRYNSISGGIGQNRTGEDRIGDRRTGNHKRQLIKICVYLFCSQIVKLTFIQTAHNCIFGECMRQAGRQAGWTVTVGLSAGKWRWAEWREELRGEFVCNMTYCEFMFPFSFPFAVSVCRPFIYG